MKYCSNCGSKMNPLSNFCPSCGEKIDFNSPKTKEVQSTVFPGEARSSVSVKRAIKKINHDIKVRNNQASITKIMWRIAGVFFVVVFLGFSEILDLHPAIVMLSIFFFIVSLVTGYMFKSREKKLEKLISGEELLAAWTLSPEQKERFICHLVEQEKGKNIIILMSISSIALIVFGVFILMIDEGKLFMFFVLIGLIVFLSLFAFGLPLYYKRSHSKGDGKVLIGKNYAYINGYFHNWDFPLSGISKVKIIKKPFRGLHLVYFYTDRTFKHCQVLVIPGDDKIDLEGLVEKLKG